jgi:nucleotide-binding universal stress UspA family protein
MNTQALKHRRQQRDTTFLEIAGTAPTTDSRVGVLAVLDTACARASAVVERGALLARSLGFRKLDLVGVATSEWRVRDGLPRARACFADTIAAFEVSVPLDIDVQVGSVTAVAIAAGLRHRPAMVVVGVVAGADGHVAVAIANALECPVFVVRGEPRSGPIVAATNMMYLRYPVLAAAARLARAVSKPATFLHAASPSPLAGLDPVGVRRLADDATTAKHARLRRLAGWVGTEADAMVVRSEFILDTIVDVAVCQDADVVSIGSRRHTWFERLRDSAAIEIVDRCPCSVLVVPVVRS